MFRVIKLTVKLTQTGICFVSALVIENYQKHHAFETKSDNTGGRVSREAHSTWDCYPYSNVSVGDLDVGKELTCWFGGKFF